MVIIIRHFLVDSENVNDNWLMLFDMADEEDEIVVFYTKKSPHMSYMSVIRLMENNSINVRFEECYEGTNALDFQLVSYMGNPTTSTRLLPTDSMSFWMTKCLMIFNHLYYYFV